MRRSGASWETAEILTLLAASTPWTGLSSWLRTIERVRRTISEAVVEGFQTMSAKTDNPPAST